MTLLSVRSDGGRLLCWRRAWLLCWLLLCDVKGCPCDGAWCLVCELCRLAIGRLC